MLVCGNNLLILHQNNHKTKIKKAISLNEKSNYQ